MEKIDWNSFIILTRGNTKYYFNTFIYIYVININDNKQNIIHKPMPIRYYIDNNNNTYDTEIHLKMMISETLLNDNDINSSLNYINNGHEKKNYYFSNHYQYFILILFTYPCTCSSL